jgi:TolB-like protein
VAPASIALALIAAAASPARAQCPDGSPPPCRAAPAPAPARAAAAAPATSVAVLPLQNRSPDSADAYLAAGLTEEVGNRLTQLGRLQVKARGLVDAQWRRTPDPFDAARRLNVAWFVHGNVRRAGAQLLVNIELIRTSTGEEVWASRFARRDTDVFAVQAEVAESVATVVGGRLNPGERAVMVRRPTADNEAYRLYLYGNALFNHRIPQELEQAVEAYMAATRRDPRFAAAWARIGLTRAMQQSWGDHQLDDDSLVALARIATRRALALDSTSSDAWVADIATSRVTGDIGRAQASCVRALRLDSLNADAWHQCADLHGDDRPGLIDPARAEPMYRRELALDPDRRNTWVHLSNLRIGQGRLAEAEAMLDTAIAIAQWAPAFDARAYVRMLRRNPDGAAADLAEVGRLTQAAALDLPFVRLLRGDSLPARAALARLRTMADSNPLVNGSVAMISASLGLRADALAALERFRAVPDPREPSCAPATPCSASLRTWSLLHDGIFLPLRDEPRFARLLEETRPRVPWR